EGVLPWSWAVERLTKAHNYWIATGGRGAAPQLTAVWGVWLDGAFYFSCAATSRKARNLAEDPRCAISTERADEAVIVEGIAELVADQALLEQFKAAYDPKYNWEIEIDKGGIFVVRPTVAFAFIEDSNQFESTATRWTFA
ncbi:MAG: pyridoxamine 5'-phosphate oxidase family protein, partial [Chloroflexi bacterium]|nr:pyridoxamine 5'-phosphate oxidase family protein [Chloroflexota bacterium]